MRDISIAAALILGGALLVGVVVLVVTRRAHYRSWRFGVFFESEDRHPPDDET